MGKDKGNHAPDLWVETHSSVEHPQGFNATQLEGRFIEVEFNDEGGLTFYVGKVIKYLSKYRKHRVVYQDGEQADEKLWKKSEDCLWRLASPHKVEAVEYPPREWLEEVEEIQSKATAGAKKAGTSERRKAAQGSHAATCPSKAKAQSKKGASAARSAQPSSDADQAVVNLISGEEDSNAGDRSRQTPSPDDQNAQPSILPCGQPPSGLREDAPQAQPRDTADSASTRGSDHSTVDPIQLDHDTFHSPGAPEHAQAPTAAALLHDGERRQPQPEAAPLTSDTPQQNWQTAGEVGTAEPRQQKRAREEDVPAGLGERGLGLPALKRRACAQPAVAAKGGSTAALLERVVASTPRAPVAAAASPTREQQASHGVSESFLAPPLAAGPPNAEQQDGNGAVRPLQAPLSAADAPIAELQDSYGAGRLSQEAAHKPTTTSPASMAPTLMDPAGGYSAERSAPLGVLPSRSLLSSPSLEARDADAVAEKRASQGAAGTSRQTSVEPVERRQGPMRVAAMPAAQIADDTLMEDASDAQGLPQEESSRQGSQARDSAGGVQGRGAAGTQQPDSSPAVRTLHGPQLPVERPDILAISPAAELASPPVSLDSLLTAIQGTISEEIQAHNARQAEETASFEASLTAKVMQAVASHFPTAFAHSSQMAAVLPALQAAVTSSAAALPGNASLPARDQGRPGVEQEGANAAFRVAGIQGEGTHAGSVVVHGDAGNGASSDAAEPSRAEAVERPRKRRLEMPMPADAAALMKRKRLEDWELSGRLQDLPRMTEGRRQAIVQAAEQRNAAAAARRSERRTQMEVEQASTAQLQIDLAALKAGTGLLAKQNATKERQRQKEEMQERLRLWQGQLDHAEKVQLAKTAQRVATKEAAAQAASDPPAAAQEQAVEQPQSSEPLPGALDQAPERCSNSSNSSNLLPSTSGPVRVAAKPLLQPRRGSSDGIGFAENSCGSRSSLPELDLSDADGFEGFWPNPLPALLTHPGAVQAHEQVVLGHKHRTSAAQKLLRGSLPARRLGGFAARCGSATIREDGGVKFGCGTALSDVHYTCRACVEQQETAGDDEEDQEDTMDFCTECLEASDWECPNPECPSRFTGDRQLQPQDYLKDTAGYHRSFSMASAELLRPENRRAAYLVAKAEHNLLKAALEGLPEGCRKFNGAAVPMYSMNAALFMRHRVGQNGLDEGVCALVRGVADFFDNAPFTPAAMLKLALEDPGNPASIMSQFRDHGGSSHIAEASVEAFFEPMMRGGPDVTGLRPDIRENDRHCGYKAPDVGIQPELQSRVFVDGLKKLGMGDYATPEGVHNLAHSLRDERRDEENGTQVPDLGPKFYIARPLLVRVRNGPVHYDGMTFTPLHCDLADAVNYSCSGEKAEWIVFRRNDRRRLMDFLQDCYGEGKLGEDILWNKTNHRLLDEDDLEVLANEYGVLPWRFVQRAGEMVVIPAGCAHQVTNGPDCYNIKVAQDFLAPQSAKVILELLAEMKTAKIEDKLQAVLTLRFAGADAWDARARTRD